MTNAQILQDAIRLQQHYAEGYKLATGLRERLEAEAATGAPKDQSPVEKAVQEALAKHRARRCKG